MKNNNLLMKTSILVLTILLLCSCNKINAFAATKYQITTNEDNQLLLFNNDELLKNVYVSVTKSGNTYNVVKPCTKNSKIFYFDKNGFGNEYTDNNLVSVLYNGKKKTYYSKNGVLLKNQIVKVKKKGYYVDSTGVVISTKGLKKNSRAYNEAKAIDYAVAFVLKHGGNGSKSSKLQKCYYAISKYSYQRTYTGLSPKKTDMGNFACEMFKNKCGNCFRYAVCFVYIAKVLGYDGQVKVGFTTSTRGGWTPHGWSTVKVNGKWYVCDPDMEQNHVASYMKTVTPCQTKITRSCKLSAKNGKIVWK